MTNIIGPTPKMKKRPIAINAYRKSRAATDLPPYDRNDHQTIVEYRIVHKLIHIINSIDKENDRDIRSFSVEHEVKPNIISMFAISRILANS